MKSTLLFLLATLSLGLGACSGDGSSVNKESSPPTRAELSPIGTEGGEERSLAPLEGEPEAGLASTPAMPKPAPSVVEGAPGGQAAETQLTKSTAPQLVETSPPPAAKMAASSNTEQEPKQKTRQIDIVGRTLDQLQQLNIKLDNSQLQKLKSISTAYDFNTVSAGDERRALRRKYMQEVYKTVLTAEQQQKVKAKRQFQE
jgi:hypothetical protein